MALLDYVDPETATGRAHELLEATREMYGRYYLYDRVLAHNPRVLETADDHYQALIYEGRLDSTLKELAFLAVSFENACEYCVSTHAELLIERLGLPHETVEAVRTDEVEALGDREAAVVAVARQVAADPKRVTDDHVDRLYAVGFDDADVVELFAAAAEAVAANALMDALDVQPADLPDGELDDYRFRQTPV